jgi:hypothetical protein
MFIDLVLQSFHPLQSIDDNITLYKVLVLSYTLYTVLQETNGNQICQQLEVQDDVFEFSWHKQARRILRWKYVEDQNCNNLIFCHCKLYSVCFLLQLQYQSMLMTHTKLGVEQNNL